MGPVIHPISQPKSYLTVIGQQISVNHIRWITSVNHTPPNPRNTSPTYGPGPLATVFVLNDSELPVYYLSTILIHYNYQATSSLYEWSNGHFSLLRVFHRIIYPLIINGAFFTPHNPFVHRNVLTRSDSGKTQLPPIRRKLLAVPSNLL